MLNHDKSCNGICNPRRRWRSIRRKALPPVPDQALQPLQGKLCEDIRDDLQRLSAQFAYFRAIGLTYDKSIYCSSLFAHNALEISDVIMIPLPAKLPPAWSLSVDQIKDADISPTLIFIRTPDDGWGAFGLVDAQYLVTLMNAVNKLRGFQLNIRVGRVRQGGVNSEPAFR
ncbi:MAG: hypothetical protein EKE20_04495, partial [Candidatus Symbiopectobacterium sp. Dall1.0]|nr:hypothetical protein [Candidatus Symbiopectobacterium sp. Dall1.0]